MLTALGDSCRLFVYMVCRGCMPPINSNCSICCGFFVQLDWRLLLQVQSTKLDRQLALLTTFNDGQATVARVTGAKMGFVSPTMPPYGDNGVICRLYNRMIGLVLCTKFEVSIFTCYEPMTTPKATQSAGLGLYKMGWIWLLLRVTEGRRQCHHSTSCLHLTYIMRLSVYLVYCYWDSNESFDVARPGLAPPLWLGQTICTPLLLILRKKILTISCLPSYYIFIRDVRV